MKTNDFYKIFKKIIEIVKPDLRHYYRIVKKAKIIKSYSTDIGYYADVQILKNDESVDEKEPIIKKVEIPVMWAGKNRGIICPPEKGTLCDLTYYDGDPNYPRISNFRCCNMTLPSADVGDMIIQKEDGTYIKICKDNNVEIKTSGNVVLDGTKIKLNDGVGVVTGDCICAYTGSKHSDISSKVIAGK